jgi:hypothetical protein
MILETGSAANTDNKVNKLVTVFALLLHLDKFVITDASGYAQLLAI